jgi:hypothetical protein
VNNIPLERGSGDDADAVAPAVDKSLLFEQLSIWTARATQKTEQLDEQGEESSRCDHATRFVAAVHALLSLPVPVGFPVSCFSARKKPQKQKRRLFARCLLRVVSFSRRSSSCAR